ncbi:MAG TPA: CDF family Co(II)/Ni(II) efflux transporter DmeF [Myxococcota bacterium]|nr:CDF family Co(II)/Ni(II) efflux transporter DmeF [Myxococcota bacterium]
MSKEIVRIDHTFGLDKRSPAEGKTKVVIIISFITMVGEIVGGILFGSMALLADGIHMATHVLTMSISYFAYRYIRKQAKNPTFSFGTGKVNALAGYTGAIMLLVFAFAMAWESVERLIQPQEISYNAAIAVAFLGLIVNIASALILGHHDHDHGDYSHKDDSNFKAIYLHIITDALTSILAILSLFIAKYIGVVWVDPLMGIVGAILIIVWSRGLFTETTSVLLDHQDGEVEGKIRQVLATFDLEIRDLHSWKIGPGIFAGELALKTGSHVHVDEIRQSLDQIKELVHLVIEIDCEHCKE